MVQSKKQYDWKGFFLNLQRNGQYTFTCEDVCKAFDLPKNSIYRRLYVHEKQKRIIKLRKGFYGIHTPESSMNGNFDIYLYVDALMKSLSKPYYVALLSAAALHGAAHQKPQDFFIMTEIPVPRKVHNKKEKISFFGKNFLLQEGVMLKKSRVGYFNVSTPELTAFDLLDNIKSFGINRITSVLQELYEEMNVSRLKKTAKLIGNKASIQRLGFILETVVGAQKLADTLYQILCKNTFYSVPLSPVKQRRGTINDKWKIIINMEIEPDL